MNIFHALKNAERFHLATSVLASGVMGLSLGQIRHERTSLPVIVRDDNGRLHMYFNGTNRGDVELLTPYVVNGAFSLELHLKLIAVATSGIWPKHHDLSKLYKDLPSPERTEIFEFVDIKLKTSVFHQHIVIALKKQGYEIDWAAENLFKRANEAFINWRYAFDKTPGCFAGYSELHQACEQVISKYDFQKIKSGI